MNPNTNTADSGTAIKVSPATAGSFILLVSFFLPWIKFFGSNLAGFELREIWKPGPYLWSIPVTAAVAIVIGLSGRKNVGVAQLAGGLPLVFLSVALYQFGADLFKGIAIGGWLTLISGTFLLCVAPRIGKKESEVSSADGNPSSTSHETEINR